METPTIRPATEQDIDGLVSLYAEFHEFHVRGVPDRLRKPDAYDEAMLRSTLRELVQRDDAQIFVVDHEGEIVGLVEVYVRQDEPHPLTVAYHWAREQHATEMQIETWEFAEGLCISTRR